jgi:DNA repair protein RecN (Recombination protein N)
LRPRAQLHLLDRYAELEALRGEVAALVARVRRVRRELDDLLLHDQERAHRADLLKFQIGEIEAAALEPGEEEPLLEERARLANAEELAELVTKALLALEEGEGETPAAMDLLGVAFRALDGLARVDASLEPQLELAESANYQVQELVRSLHDYEEQIEYNPRRLRVVEDRLALIHRLKRKYGETVEEVLAYGERAAQELNSLTHSDERVSELRAQEARLLNELSALAPQLSRGRREAAQRLAQAIERELQDLRMAGARFGVAFEWRPDPEGVPLPEDVTELRFQVTGEGVERSGEVEDDGPSVAFDGTGIDQIEFLVSANPGEPLKPMAKIASGGETARLMLSLKAVLSRADETATLIFDEIDQGIGGRVGATVGEKLWRLTEAASPTETRHQVLCVTHLPQLAGFGDVHFHVEKVVAGERTVTRVRRLQGPERVDELVQMLGARGEAGHRSAALMLEQVDEVKQRARQSSS